MESPSLGAKDNFAFTMAKVIGRPLHSFSTILILKNQKTKVVSVEIKKNSVTMQNEPVTLRVIP
jgi:hypothetical protein